jgi:hypothetical protein
MNNRERIYNFSFLRLNENFSKIISKMTMGISFSPYVN